MSEVRSKWIENEVKPNEIWLKWHEWNQQTVSKWEKEAKLAEKMNGKRILWNTNQSEWSTKLYEIRSIRSKWRHVWRKMKK